MAINLPSFLLKLYCDSPTLLTVLDPTTQKESLNVICSVIGDFGIREMFWPEPLKRK
jgi:hypothetical protein